MILNKIFVTNIVCLKKNYVKVRRVQKHIETLDMLRMTRQNSIPLKNDENKIKMHYPDDFQRQGNAKKQQAMQHSDSVVVTTKWETFD